RLDDFVDELLGPEVVDPRPGILRQHGVGYGLHQVRFPEPGRAVDEERVVGLAGRFGDRVRGGRGQLVRLADDAGLERVALVERRRVDAGLFERDLLAGRHERNLMGAWTALLLLLYI